MDGSEDLGERLLRSPSHHEIHPQIHRARDCDQLQDGFPIVNSPSRSGDTDSRSERNGDFYLRKVKQIQSVAMRDFWTLVLLLSILCFNSLLFFEIRIGKSLSQGISPIDSSQETASTENDEVGTDSR